MFAATPDPARAGLTLIVCPAETDRRDDTIFFGGGITNCPDWQQDLARLLAGEALTGLNPRREHFPIDDPTASEFRIAWEHRYLRFAEAISFWFPRETVCPITLYELGTYMRSDKPIFIGMHPEYQRADEVLAYTSVHSPEVHVVYSLEELAAQIRSWSCSIERRRIPTVDPRVIPDSLFLAGGIRDCPNWQGELSAALVSLPVQLHNPRLESFEAPDRQWYRDRLAANHRLLRVSEAVSFWFAKETLNPVVLYELGMVSAGAKPLFIGVEPGYGRQADVEIQTRIARPDVRIVHSLAELAGQIRDYYTGRKK